LTDEQWAQAQKQVQAEAHNGIGMGEMIRKKYDTAISEFKTAAELDPGEFTYQVRLASAYDSSGKHDDAIAVPDKIIAAPACGPNPQGDCVLPQVAQAAKSIKETATKAKGAPKQ